ncbi:glycosyltransferase family 2 protein [Methylobacterium planeticum]|uniref:glycosyltransferase family 2 protein n=1 Tax=Methylobacterium planeticum TaxID=2615211 RepID=UPI001FEF3071|nr:glycosyltransferase [Methylobacterium planeticum]
MSTPRLRIALAVATAGRPACVLALMERIARQVRSPDTVIVCGSAETDVAGIAERFPEVRVITSRRGLACQRNAILAELTTDDVAVFLDDDFIPGPGYIAAVEAVLRDRPDVVMTTGHVLRDGIRGPGFDVAFADAVLAADTGEDRDAIEEAYSGYGCNMAVRLAPVRRHGLAFDETLPLYAWLEDVDFSRQIARHGPILKVAASRGVHLGIKSGRQSGVKLGYSQIANPIHLVRKGTCSHRKALFLMSRNIAANLSRCARPEPSVDRLGRCLGNLRAALDLITGRLDPTRILAFDGSEGAHR